MYKILHITQTVTQWRDCMFGISSFYELHIHSVLHTCASCGCGPTFRGSCHGNCLGVGFKLCRYMILTWRRWCSLKQNRQNYSG